MPDEPDRQRDAIAFLGNPASYGFRVGTVETLNTHISRVFLAGERAYKLKRAIKYSYVDFSTVELRRRACAAELSLNRRTAPELYLDVRAISRRPDGSIGWGRGGTVVDWVVVMRRFAQDGLLDAIARAGGLTPALLYALAAHIAEFHAAAEPCPEFGGAAVAAEIVRNNDGLLRGCRAVGFAHGGIDDLRARSLTEAARIGAVLDRRRTAGKVRRCHGDLHLRNICVLDGRPVLFDCLEFSDRLASIDVLYDLAFLLMDLDHRGFAGFANLVFNRYLDLTGEDDGLAAMPLFLSQRAAIRAHVAGTAIDHAVGGGDAEAGKAAEAQAYLDLARAVLTPSPARLIAIGGLSGTGKSSLAAALAPTLGLRPGARVLRSDVIRKRLLGAEPEEKLPEAAYAPEISARVYGAIRARAAAALRAGYCAIIDAVALRPEERQEFAAVASQAGVPFCGLWLEAPEAALVARVGARRDDASDATGAVVRRQVALDPGPVEWHRVDAGRDLPETLAAARQLLTLS